MIPALALARSCDPRAVDCLARVLIERPVAAPAPEGAGVP
jgi:hypothetical protein